MSAETPKPTEREKHGLSSIELAPPDYYDPVIEAYKKDVDRTLLSFRPCLRNAASANHLNDVVPERQFAEIVFLPCPSLLLPIQFVTTWR